MTPDTRPPAVEDFDPWICALRGLVLAVGGFAVCVMAFVTTLCVLARGW